MKIFVLPFSFLLLSLGLAQGENWPQFRGPNLEGNSTETGVPISWSDTSNVVWKIEIPGESWSSPIVWNDRVLVTTATDNGQSCRVISIHATTGQTLWNKEVFQQVLRKKEGRNTYATPTPATDGKAVYACFGDGSFVALNYAGEVLWTNRNYLFYGQHGLGSSPILYKDTLIMARDGSSDGADEKLGWQKPWDQSRLLALDTRTGKEKWIGKRGLSRISHGAPNLWEHDGKTEVISEAGDVVQGFEVETGQLLWSSEVIGEGKVPSTVIGEGLVFTAGGWGGKNSIKAFQMGGKGNLKETNLKWEQGKGMPRIPSMLYYKPNLYSISEGGIASCMEGTTGKLLWQERIGGNFSASPVSADGKIYFIADDGTTTVIEAGSEYKVVARNSIGGKVQASIAISKHRLFIRTASHLFCIGSSASSSKEAKPIGYWKFDETTGDKTIDSSGNENHGRMIGATRAPGKFRGGVECKQDGLVQIEHSATLDDLSSGMTIAAWVNRKPDGTWNTVASREVKAGPSEYYGLAIVKNKALFSIDPDGAHYKNIKSVDDMPTGEWIHLAGTYDNNEFKLYVNGKMVISGKINIPIQQQDTNPLIIGGNTNSRGESWVDCFHGKIDEVRFYNRALNESQIADLASMNF